MKKIRFGLMITLVIVVAGLSVIMSCKCASSGEEAQRRIKNVVDSIQYVKDTRTGFCFAYWEDGKALATVPCEAIPSQLLTMY